ncbi:MAG: zinc-ribbon domain-containing protein [Bacilli bacterium]
MSLFDKIKNKTAQGVSKAISTTDKALKKAEISRSVNKLQDELRRHYEEFGRSAYKMGTIAQETVDEFAAQCRMIEESIDQLNEKARQLDEDADDDGQTVESQRRLCPQCGMENELTSKFCSSCGTELQDQA